MVNKMPKHKMDMNPEEIRVKMLRVKVTQAAISRKLKVSKPVINQVIDGKSVSDRIRRAIADAIGEDVRRMWPSTYIIHGGPRKPGRPKSD